MAKASQTARHRGAADLASTRPSRWQPSRSTFLRQNGLRVFFDAEHFFDGYFEQRRVLPAGPRRSRRGGAETLVLCDTNGGTLPDDVEAHRRRHRARTSSARSACTSTTTPGARWPTPSPRSARAPPRSRVVSTATASAPATPICPPRSPTCSLKLDIHTIPADRLERLTPVSHHIAEIVNVTRPATALRRHRRLRPQGGAAHERHRSAARRLRARRAGHGRQRHALCRVGARRALDPRVQSRRARARARLRGPRQSSRP